MVWVDPPNQASV